ncbi:uncharacterized protein LOC119614128 [Lucilia sericata]|uniref:uncharacterized protein LOC119614128 n=1 Tax=Lucilia sericata TaxID=13632 RepID=UPI0018A82747|nr:uncharacterized protein LOC119614128 [Lucilia sericata]
MSNFKICAILLVLILSQTAFVKSENSSEKTNTNLTSKQSFLKYVITSFSAMIQEYSEKSLKVSRAILKNEEFKSHHEPLIEEFKHNLTQFLDYIEANNNVPNKLVAIDMFTNTTDFYYEIPEQKLTSETKYILEILNKYRYKDIEVEMEKKFSTFEKYFKKMFEEFKSEWDERALEWYEKYQNIQDFKEKFNAFTNLKIF